MWDRLLNLFARRPKNPVGVDIGTGSVKIVELQERNGQLVLVHATVVDLPPGTMENGYCRDAAALTQVLRQAVNSSGISEKHAVLVVGSPVLFIREVTYPVMSLEELGEAIKWDNEKYIPYEEGSYYLDFAITGRISELEMRVLLAATPSDIIDTLTAAAKSAGLIPVAIDAEPLAHYRTLQNAENSMLVDIGCEVAKVTLFQNGSPAVTRPIPIAGKALTDTLASALELDFVEAERFKKRQQCLLHKDGDCAEPTPLQLQIETLVLELARETRRTFEFYKMQNKSAEMDKLFITGGGARLNNLLAIFRTQFDVPVIVHDPLANIPIASPLDTQYLRELSPQLGIAVGLALRGGDDND